MRRFALLLLAVQGTFAADWFAIGARVGAPLTDAFEAFEEQSYSFESATRRFTIGPSAELLLPFGFGLEADVLYKRTEMTVITQPGGDGTPSEPTTESDTVGVWEIPILGKYRLPGAGLRPFVTGGGSYRSFGDFPSFATNLNDSGWGLSFGAGLEIKISRVRISPEIRFTRWGSGRRDEGGTAFEYNRNQADFLVGITF